MSEPPHEGGSICRAQRLSHPWIDRRRQSTMCSQTFLGRDVFAAYWDLATMGYIETRRPLDFPSGEELSDHVASDSDHHDRFLTLVQSFMGLDPVVVRIARDEAPWATGQSRETTEGMLSLWAGRILSTEDLCGESVDAVLEVSSARAVTSLVDAWIGGQYCFGDRAREPGPDLESALRVLARIVGEDTIVAREVMQGLWRWKNERLPSILLGGVDAYVAWLRNTSLV